MIKVISILTILCFSASAYATDCPNALIKAGTVSTCEGYLISPEVAKELFQTQKEDLPNLQKRYTLLDQELALNKDIVIELRSQIVVLKTDIKQLVETKDKIASDYRDSLQSQAWKTPLFVAVGVVGTILVVIAVGFAVKSFSPQVPKTN